MDERLFCFIENGFSCKFRLIEVKNKMAFVNNMDYHGNTFPGIKQLKEYLWIT
jgi:hypothetical protein